MKLEHNWDFKSINLSIFTSFELILSYALDKCKAHIQEDMMQCKICLEKVRPDGSICKKIEL
jgi:hypothetical protein